MRAFLRVGEGDVGGVGLPDRRGRRLRLDPQAGACRSSATCGSASAGSAPRRAGSRTSRAATTRSHTVWDWSAGVGRTTDGRDVGWNLVSGINDPPQRSERAIWVDGEPTEPAPVSFEGLDAIALDGGAARVQRRVRAREAGEARRSSSTSYRQPFGTFTGTLPGGLELERGLGVMEHHDAHW